MVPFKWGYEVVDTRPPGAAYRRVTKQLHAVDTTEGEVAFVVGHGLTDKRPVVEVIRASTPAEAANATLKMVGALRRSKARSINRTHKTLVSDHRAAAKLLEKAAAEVSSGNVGEGSPGSLTPSSVASGQVGDPVVLMPA